MKKLALISTFCNTPEKQEILEINIDKMFKLGVDILIFTPKGLLPERIINKSTHCIITSENPIPPILERSMLEWKHPVSKFNIKHTLIHQDYGWASLNQIKRLLSYASNLGYDILYPMIYDLDLTFEIEDIIKSNKINYFFRNTRNNGVIITGIGASFGVFDNENALKISNRLNKKDYEGFKSAERYYHSIQKLLNIKIHNYITHDLIYDLKSSIYFNSAELSNIKDVKIFVDNTRFHRNLDECEVGIHFYDIKLPTNVLIGGVNYLIESEKVIFIKLNTPDICININGEKLMINNLDSPPIVEMKINDNNGWSYLKSKLKTPA